MAKRKVPFATGEIFHCFNRGIEKSKIFNDQQDYIYFLKLLKHLNTSEVLGKLRLQEKRAPVDSPVTILSYCLLPNHYHLVLKNNRDGGISEYLKRVSGGYTMYFNEKNERSGRLFQGVFKDEHIVGDQNLRQILAYVRFNYLVHHIADKKLYRSSLNTKDPLVRDLASNFGETAQKDVVEIIMKQRAQTKLI